MQKPRRATYELNVCDLILGLCRKRFAKNAATDDNTSK